jgi:cytochrome c-type biogenesis protein CcsB
MTDTYSQFSVLSLYSAMGLYAIAFILFTLDLSGVASSKARLARIALSLTWLGFVWQLIATVLRGIAASRVPWANMYEFAMTGTLMIMLVFLVVNLKWDIRYLGAFITGFDLLALGISATRYYVEVVPLPPALQSYWLVIHVFVATLATGFFALGFALSLAQVLQERREQATTEKQSNRWAWLSRLPSSITLENFAYRLIIVGFVLWTFTLIAGAVWAEKAWGRYWGWDVKEVWTFIIWTIYAGYLHARSTRGWRGSRSATLAMIGFAAVIFNFTVVNIFFKGLHAYSGLS